jgi:hypothetical protein
VIGFVWAFVGAVFGAGVAWATMKADVKKAQTDVNRVADLGRANDGKAERRWKHMIANFIEELEPKDKSARIAKLLREDAWRN